MDDKVRVVVADDQRLARMYVDMFVASSSRYELAASLPLAEDALAWCRRNSADLVIMDVVMEQGMNGLAAAAQLKKEMPDVRVILATSMAQPEWMDEAKRAGIESFWYKEYSRLPLLEIMDRTMAGESVYEDEPPQAFLGDMPTSDLTDQQKKLLLHLTQGLPNREIAEKMYVSPLTVKSYLEQLMERTGIHSRTELAVKASKLGLFTGR
ncbi:MAG: response regulator transcription factor [Clostridia bacterium]|nr:response regulator transcription factor [Clostridia bacterium]